MTITLEQADAGVARATDEIQRENAEHEADRRLGQIMRTMADGANGAGTGRKFRDAIIRATLPGTPERELQNKSWALLTARLNKLVGDVS